MGSHFKDIFDTDKPVEPLAQALRLDFKISFEIARRPEGGRNRCHCPVEVPDHSAVPYLAKPPDNDFRSCFSFVENCRSSGFNIDRRISQIFPAFESVPIDINDNFILVFSTCNEFYFFPEAVSRKAADPFFAHWQAIEPWGSLQLLFLLFAIIRSRFEPDVGDHVPTHPVPVIRDRYAPFLVIYIIERQFDVLGIGIIRVFDELEDRNASIPD